MPTKNEKMGRTTFGMIVAVTLPDHCYRCGRSLEGRDAEMVPNEGLRCIQWCENKKRKNRKFRGKS